MLCPASDFAFAAVLPLPLTLPSRRHPVSDELYGVKRHE